MNAVDLIGEPARAEASTIPNQYVHLKLLTLQIEGIDSTLRTDTNTLDILGWRVTAAEALPVTVKGVHYPGGGLAAILDTETKSLQCGERRYLSTAEFVSSEVAKYEARKRGALVRSAAPAQQPKQAGETSGPQPWKGARGQK